MVTRIRRPKPHEENLASTSPVTDTDSHPLNQRGIREEELPPELENQGLHPTTPGLYDPNKPKAIPALLARAKNRKYMVARENLKANNLGMISGAVVTKKNDKPYFRIDPANWGIVHNLKNTFTEESALFRGVVVKWTNGTCTAHEVDELYVIHPALSYGKVCERVEYKVVH